MRPRHYLYPLNPKSGYQFEDDRGNFYPTSVEGFFDCFAAGGSAEWGIYRGIRNLKAKDFIWVHFAFPVSAILAVGRVRDVPHLNENLERHAVWIDWDQKLTKRLQVKPIHFSTHQQVVPVAVREATPKTQKVIDKWMRGSSIGRPSFNLKPIKFKKVLIEQRLGQSEFRHSLMVAYGYRCAVTSCDVKDTLQAAHIVPVSNSGQHQVNNGLLLRADIHNLFDRGLLTIDDRYVVKLHLSVRSSPTYKSFHGKKLAIVPVSKKHKPSLKLLAQHRRIHFSN